MRTVSGTRRLSSVLSLEEKDDDVEDKAWAESFRGSVALGHTWRWTVARNALWIECSVVGGRVSHRACGPARSQAASCSGRRRVLATHQRASLRGCFRLARL